ncbi:MAG: alpha-hydroxy-acid oxidizing protein [Deinococcales bacterium]
MSIRAFAALDRYHLLPRVLHYVQEVNLQCQFLGVTIASPLIPKRKLGDKLDHQPSLLDMSQSSQELESFAGLIPLLNPEKMGILVARLKQLASKKPLAICLDMSVLVASPPIGAVKFLPKSREDLAELVAVANCPLWIYGISSPADAEIAAEAGCEGIIINTSPYENLAAPATIEIFGEIFDTVAGTLSTYVGGPIRHGVDIFRYLAIGAQAVIIESDRALEHLQAELAYAMRLTGCESLADIGYEAIYAPLFERN